MVAIEVSTFAFCGSCPSYCLPWIGWMHPLNFLSVTFQRQEGLD